MNIYIAWAYEHIYQILVIAAPIICFAWYKLKYQKLGELSGMFFILGVTLTALGAFLSSLTFSPQKTLQFLLLRDLEVAGRFIPIGYCLILVSALFCLDSWLEKVFKVNDNKETLKAASLLSRDKKRPLQVVSGVILR